MSTQGRPNILELIAAEVAFWIVVVLVIALMIAIPSTIIAGVLWLIMHSFNSLTFWGYWQISAVVIFIAVGSEFMEAVIENKKAKRREE